MIDEIQQKVAPVIDDTRRTMVAVATVAENLQAGHGSLGRLLTDDSDADQTMETARGQAAALASVIVRFDDAARQIDDSARRIGLDKGGLPDMIRRADAVLQNLQSATRDVARATPNLPETMNNLARGAADLPALLNQIQITASEVEQLATQLRGLWVLGGDGSKPPPQARLPATGLQL